MANNKSDNTKLVTLINQCAYNNNTILIAPENITVTNKFVSSKVDSKVMTGSAKQNEEGKRDEP